MMNSIINMPESSLHPEIESALQATRPSVPTGFAARAAAAFEAACAKRLLKRLMLMSAGLFAGASAAIWLAVLNIGHLGDAIWEGLSAAAAIIRSVFTLWYHMPVFGVAFAGALMLLTLMLGGVVSKLDSRAVSVK